MRDDSTQLLEQRFGSAIGIAAIAVAQFLVFCPAAMLVYPGDFSVVSDYLSFLGCFETLSSWHAWLFNASLIALGSGLFWLFWSMYQVTRNDPGELLICSATGMLTAVSLICVGLLPLNMFPHGHNFAMISWLLFTVVTLVFWIDWQRRDAEQKPTSLGRLGVIAIMAYPLAVVLALGPVMQKIVVLSAIGWMGCFCLQLQQALGAGDVRRWLGGRRPRLAQKQKRVKVHDLTMPSSTDRSRVGRHRGWSR